MAVAPAVAPVSGDVPAPAPGGCPSGRPGGHPPRAGCSPGWSARRGRRWVSRRVPGGGHRRVHRRPGCRGIRRHNGARSAPSLGTAHRRGRNQSEQRRHAEPDRQVAGRRPSAPPRRAPAGPLPRTAGAARPTAVPQPAPRSTTPRYPAARAPLGKDAHSAPGRTHLRAGTSDSWQGRTVSRTGAPRLTLHRGHRPRSGLGREALVGQDGAASVGGEDEPILDLAPDRPHAWSRPGSRDPHLVDDLVQETLARVMARRSRRRAGVARPVRDRHGPQPDRLRSCSASDRARRNAHLLADPDGRSRRPEDEAAASEERRRWSATALARLPPAGAGPPARARGRGHGHGDARRRAAAPPRARSPPSSAAPGPSCGWSTCSRRAGRAADRPVPAGAVRAVRRRPAPPTASSTPPATCSAATSARR